MTREEITALAAQVWSAGGTYIGPSIAQLTEFAALVAAKEREACAQACDLEAATWPYPSHGNAALTIAATAIRARRGRNDYRSTRAYPPPGRAMTATNTEETA